MPPKSIDGLLQEIRLASEEQYQVTDAVRNLVKSTFPQVSEEIKYGGILFTSTVQFCGVFAYTDHVSLEFGHGAKIKDPFGQLEGSGRLRRHLKIRSVAQIESKYLAEYLQLALHAAKSADNSPDP